MAWARFHGDARVVEGLERLGRGVVRVPRSDRDATRDIATLMAGDFFGEMALLQGRTRTATCRAITPCAFYELARSEVDSVVQNCPAMREAVEDADRQRRDQLREAGADLIQ